MKFEITLLPSLMVFGSAAVLSAQTSKAESHRPIVSDAPASPCTNDAHSGFYERVGY